MHAFADNLAKKIMPKISKTEEAALQAGTVGFDGELFNGNPSLANLIKKYDVSLRDDETAFMNDQVEKLCALLDDYEVTRDRDMPENVWDYLKREKVRNICEHEILLYIAITKTFFPRPVFWNGHSQSVWWPRIYRAWSLSSRYEDCL